MGVLGPALWALTSTAMLSTAALLGVAVLGALVHVLIRSGRDSARLARLEDDIRALRRDTRELFWLQVGRAPPSDATPGGPPSIWGVDAPPPRE